MLKNSIVKFITNEGGYGKNHEHQACGPMEIELLDGSVAINTKSCLTITLYDKGNGLEINSNLPILISPDGKNNIKILPEE